MKQRLVGALCAVLWTLAGTLMTMIVWVRGDRYVDEIADISLLIALAACVASCWLIVDRALERHRDQIVTDVCDSLAISQALRDADARIPHLH